MITYRVKVRGTDTFIWGGKGVKADFNPQTNVFLHFRVDENDYEIVSFFRLKKNDDRKLIADLQPGECLTVRIESDWLGVVGTTSEPADANVDCTIEFTG